MTGSAWPPWAPVGLGSAADRAAAKRREGESMMEVERLAELRLKWQSRPEETPAGKFGRYLGRGNGRFLSDGLNGAAGAADFATVADNAAPTRAVGTW